MDGKLNLTKTIFKTCVLFSPTAVQLSLDVFLCSATQLGCTENNTKVKTTTVRYNTATHTLTVDPCVHKHSGCQGLELLNQRYCHLLFIKTTVRWQEHFRPWQFSTVVLLWLWMFILLLCSTFRVPWHKREHFSFGLENSRCKTWWQREKRENNFSRFLFALYCPSFVFGEI